MRRRRYLNERRRQSHRRHACERAADHDGEQEKQGNSNRLHGLLAMIDVDRSLARRFLLSPLAPRTKQAGRNGPGSIGRRLAPARLDLTGRSAACRPHPARLWDESDHLRIAHQREAAVVQDQPPPVHTLLRMVFLRQEVSQDDDLHIVDSFCISGLGAATTGRASSRENGVTLTRDETTSESGSVQPGSCHLGAARTPKTERRPHAQVRPGVSDAGPRHAMLRKR